MGQEWQVGMMAPTLSAASLGMAALPPFFVESLGTLRCFSFHQNTSQFSPWEPQPPGPVPPDVCPLALKGICTSGSLMPQARRGPDLESALSQAWPCL